MMCRLRVLLVLVCGACSQQTRQNPATTSTSSATDADAIRQLFPGFVAAKLARDVEMSFLTSMIQRFSPA